MTRCYEREWYRILTGRSSINHCGGSVEINGVDYCKSDGKLPDYGGYCADREKPETLEFIQIKLEI